MKKSILIILSLLFCVSCFAQKKYLLFTGGSGPTSNSYLTGDLPAGYSSTYSNGVSNYMTAGNLLNKLITEEGFIVENFSGADGSFYILLSRQVNNEDDAISIVRNDDGDVKEVARYNLQGIPVNENTPGIQIVVYSNYTTKTIIVE